MKGERVSKESAEGKPLATEGGVGEVYIAVQPRFYGKGEIGMTDLGVPDDLVEV